MNDKLRYDLAKPLLIIKEKNGFLACAYINPDTCNKTGEACAIVSGINNYDDMKNAKVIAVSESAKNLGIKIGDSGQEAIEKLR
ncbi:MAG: YunC family protein [Candidatus Thiodiazotropha sp. (ex Epidulcina cf. delphinae)]|nr:YunC family protein [Candidatus Thiodiazotropha sp. (ex Epidulcina cf. delphinae)]